MIVKQIVQMKLLRSIRIMSLLLFISMVQCQKAAIRATQVKPSPKCALENYTKDKSFLNERAEVVDMCEDQPGRPHPAYYLKAPSVHRMYLYACNLPEQVKKHGLRVKISGHTLTNPYIGRSNIEAWPCELTSLKVIGK